MNKTTELISVLCRRAINLGIGFKYIPDDEGEGYTLMLGDKSFYNVQDAIAFFEDENDLEISINEE